MTEQTVTAPTSHERFLRLAIALQTLTIFFQAVSAGLLLTADYGETLHSAGARVMYAAAMLYVLAAVLAWKPGGAPPRQIWYATGFLVLASAQVVLGIKHVAEVHVPLGVTMFALSVLALAFRWTTVRPRRQEAGPSAGAPRAEAGEVRGEGAQG